MAPADTRPVFLVGLVLVSFVLISIIPTASCFFIDSKQSPRAHEWSYVDQQHWNRRHKDCALRAQSPIDIQHKNVIISQQLRLHFYNYNRALKFKLSNAHHTIKMSPVLGGGADEQANSSGPLQHDIIGADEFVEFEQHQPATDGDKQQLLSSSQQQQQQQQQQPSGRLKLAAKSAQLGEQNNQLELGAESQLPYGGAPSIKLDWLDDGNNEFKLRDIHFHWGERRDNGSEHAIDNRRAAMEMHLVHIKQGLDKSAISFTSDSVTVIAILIESHRKSNADFNPIVNELVRINATEEAQEIDYKSIYDLLPSKLDAFYTYSGSLTTPPCYQVVNWVVMAERLNMNAKQIEMFRNLYAPQSHSAPDQDDETPLIVPNVRALQPLNNRTILASFTKYGSRIEAVWSSANSLNRGANSIYLSLLDYNHDSGKSSLSITVLPLPLLLLLIQTASHHWATTFAALASTLLVLRMHTTMSNKLAR